MNKSLFVAALVACAAAASAESPAGVSMTAKLPPLVYMTGSGPSIATAIMAVENKTGAVVPLTVPNSCGIALWSVTDPQGKVIEGHNICPMIYQPQIYNLPAAGRHDNLTIDFDGKDYRDGATYTLHLSYWGLTADAPFKVSKK